MQSWAFREIWTDTPATTNSYTFKINSLSDTKKALLEEALCMLVNANVI